MIYRGYTLRPYSDGQHEVLKNGGVVHTAMSEEAAYAWIDAERKKAIASENKDK